MTDPRQSPRPPLPRRGSSGRSTALIIIGAVLLSPGACTLISSIGWDLTGFLDRTTLLLVIVSSTAGVALIWAGLRRPAR